MPPRSPNRVPRPVITKDADRPSSPISKSSKLGSGGVQEVASYVIPASSASGRNHHRHSSLTTGERLRPLERDPRERAYPGGSSRPSALRPPREDERDYNYEYTGPKKEFLREGPPVPLPRARERRDSYNIGRERPTSMIVPERPEMEYHRNRDALPPPARGPEGLGRAESVRLRRRPKDDDLNQREMSGRAYVRDEPREERGYQDPRRPSRKGTEDDYVPYADVNPRHNRPRQPDVDGERTEPRHRHRKHHQDEDGDPRTDIRSRDHDDKYERRRAYHDDRENLRDRDHHREFDEKGNRDRRPREEPPEKREREDDGGKGGIIAAGAASAAAAGAAGLAAEGVRRHRQKESEERDAPGRSSKDSRTGHLEAPIDRDSESTSLSGENYQSGGPEDEDRRERRRRRQREKEREEREYHEAREHDRRQTESISSRVPAQGEHDSQTASRELVPSTGAPPSNPKDSALREQKSYERQPDPESSPREQRNRRHRRQRRHHSRTRDDDSYSSPTSPSSEETDDDEDDNFHREPPRVVTPSNEIVKSSLPPQPPKGILKKAKDKFPEPPNPVREGVAPLDAAKKGIPPEARWTRINRRLVNPEALEQEGIRFEEYPEYVIVLKVLDQEDINKFAQKTHEIREKRRAQMGAPPGTDEVSDRS